MNVSITLPDDVGQQLKTKWEDIPGKALEALASEAYRSGIITDAEVMRMLNLKSRWHVEHFLKHSLAYMDYTEADFKEDIATLDRLTSK